MAARKAKTKAAPKPRIRKPIVAIINELKSWLPNYDHDQDYPQLLIRILAGLPGGERLEDMGYQPFLIGWHEADQLGRVLEAIQDKQDVEDIVREVYESDDPEDVEEAPRVTHEAGAHARPAGHHRHRAYAPPRRRGAAGRRGR